MYERVANYDVTLIQRLNRLFSSNTLTERREGCDIHLAFLNFGSRSCASIAPFVVPGAPVRGTGLACDVPRTCRAECALRVDSFSTACELVSF